MAVLAAVFLWPVGASLVASFSHDGQWTLANYDTVWRLYARDVAYTLGVAAAGSALTFAVTIPLCGWLRARSFGPVDHDGSQSVQSRFGDQPAPVMACLWPGVGKQGENSVD